MREQGGSFGGSADPTREPARPGRPAPPDPPFRIGRYETRRLIARHGQGYLYQALDPPETLVAIKVVVAGAGADDGPERCEREVRALSRLAHPNIVAIRDPGAEITFAGARARYFVMEYLRGARPITEYAERHSLSIAERVRLAIAVCDALAAGHAENILHRDIKPANVLVVDKIAEPKVIDFGLSAGRGVDPAEILETHEHGEILGTTWYLAPEHFERNPDLIVEQTDVYSMGVVLFELLAGVPPYPVRSARSLHELEDVIRNHPPLRPSRARPELRGDLEAIMLRAIEKDPRRRYVTMDALADDLRSWLDARRPDARAGRTWTRAGSAIQRAAFVAPGAVMCGVWLAATLFAAGVVRPLSNDFTPLTRWSKAAAIAVSDAVALRTLRFNSVRAVVISGQTDLAGIAGALGIQGLRPEDARTYRPLWGRVLSRLGEASPSVVAIDIGFLENGREDPELIQGIEDLQRAGCVVAAGLPDWPRYGLPDPLLDGDVTARCLMGGCTGTYKQGSSWRTDLAVRQPGESSTTPSLALAVMAAREHNGAACTFEIYPRRSAVLVRADGPVAQAAAEIRASAVRRDAGIGEGAIGRGAIVAHLEFPVPGDEAFADATVDAGEIFAMSESELIEAFHRRVVVLANSRTGRDPAIAPDGRELSGHQAVMTAIGALISKKWYRNATHQHDVVAASAGAALGMAGYGAFFAPRRRRIVFLLLAASATTLVCFVLFARVGNFVNPLPVAVATVLACELGAIAARVRRVRSDDSIFLPGGGG